MLRTATHLTTITLMVKIPGLKDVSVKFTPHSSDSTAWSPRSASAAYLNRVSFEIQDNADDAGWQAAQHPLAAADKAHRAGDFAAAHDLVDIAYRIAFPSHR